MFRNYFTQRLSWVLFKGIRFFVLLAVMVSTPSLGTVQKVDAQDASPEGAPSPPGTFEKPEMDYQSSNHGIDKGFPNSHSFSDRYPEKSIYSELSSKVPWDDIPVATTGIEVNSNGILPVPSEGLGGDLPGGIDPRSLPDGITVDLTYDVVMGFVGPGETVSVTMGTEGYGAALADGVGFFWTPIWHNTDGVGLDIVCGDAFSIVVGSDSAIEIVPPCMTGGIDVLNDQVQGSITGDTGGTELFFQPGEYGILFDQLGRLQPQPPGGGVMESVFTETDGSYNYHPGFASNLGAESLFSIDFQVNGIWIRSYVYPNQPVFMIQQYNMIAGYAETGKTITAEVYDGSSTLKSSNVTTAYGPHGFYTFNDVPIEAGDSVEVQVEGESKMITTVDYLGEFVFDVDNDTLTGSAPEGELVRAVLWQNSGEARFYLEDEITAISGDTFTIDFIVDHDIDLRSRDEVLVILPDANGNQVQIFSGPPYVGAFISLDSNLDCVFGRLDEPGLPIIVTLEKSGGDVYTRDTGFFTDVGNSLGGPCFVIQDGEGNFVDFSLGDTVTLKSDDVSKWSGSVEVVDFTWSGDTTNDIISGTSTDGDLELTVHQWQDGSYPFNGTATMQVPVSSGTFNANFSNFDIRDGDTMDFSHYDPVTGYGVLTNGWSYWPTLPFFELNLPYGISGMVGSPGETVTAKLYDGENLLGETSDDWIDDPYHFWLDNFGEHSLQPGYRVEVGTSGGWSGEMIVPELSIDGDVSSDMLTSEGPTGKLFFEVWDDFGYISQFVPGPTALLNLVYFGWDLQPSDFISASYQAVDGNRARVQSQSIEVSEVEFFFNPGSDDWMWGRAKPGTVVTAERDGSILFTAYADPACDGCWGIDESLDLYPGDIITVTAGDGLSPVVIQIPDPLTAYADSSTDEVWGQIDHLDNEMVEVHGNWEEGYQEIYTDSSGNYSAIYTDIPQGADGYVRYVTMVNWSNIVFHQYFRTPDLALNVNYGHDWIEGWYPPGYEVTLTVTESDKLTEKASITLTTAEIPWWGGGTGFSTNLEGVSWDPEQPDIQAGDWVLGEVEVDTVIYTSEVRIGTITGEVDITTDSISGTIDAPLLPQDVEVPVWCDPSGSPGGVDSKQDWVLPNGSDTYTCAWDPSTEWDVGPGQDIAVSYATPENHSIQNVFKGYTDELIFNIHYDHDWIDGIYEPDHTVDLTVYDSDDRVKATISLPTGYIDDWGDTTGFATYQEGAQWMPDHPDIQPGDRVHGEVDDGSQFTADVVIGQVTGEADLDYDSISGTVDADWLMPGPVDVGCYIWEDMGPENKYDTVTPDDVDTYECSWPDGEWDIVPGTNLMVAYFEPGGHEVIGDFRPPAPYLQIQTWFIGEGSPGVGGNAAFSVQYKNQGEAPAENVAITATMVGMSYLRDSSGFVPGGVDTEKTWDLGKVDSGDWIEFILFTEVTAAVGGDIINTVEIVTSNPYDQGESWEKVSAWEGNVVENDTHLNVGKDTWTWNPAPEEDFVYQINVCNNGSTSSSVVTLKETLPEATVFGNWWGSDPGWQEFSQIGDELVLEHSCISSWSCSELFIRVSVEPGAMPGDDLINHVEISADNDLSVGDDVAELQHQVGEPYTDLALGQDWHWGWLVPGGYYRYGITFRNNGNEKVTGPVEITATLPEGTSFAGWDSWGETSPSLIDNTENVLTWEIGDMIAGAYGTIEVWVDIDSTTAPGTELEHSTEIEVQLGEEDTGNNTHLFTEMVHEHGPNLRIQKDGGVHGHGDGHFAYYNLRVENIGDETVNDVVITDTYPSGMVLDGDVNVDYGEGWSVETFADHFSVTLDRLEPGVTSNIYFDTKIPGEDPLEPGVIYENIAEANPLAEDVNPDDNFTSYTMATGPDLFVEKSLESGLFSPGEEITYLLTFGNMHKSNEWWWNMAGNAIITDILPEGMSFVSAEMHWCESTEWCEVMPDFDGQTLTWDLYPIGRSNWNEIRLTVEIGDVESTNPLINEAMISSDQPEVDVDPYPENNYSFYDPGLVVTHSIYLPIIVR